jgi:hypothetical protein
MVTASTHTSLTLSLSLPHSQSVLKEAVRREREEEGDGERGKVRERKKVDGGESVPMDGRCELFLHSLQTLQIKILRNDSSIVFTGGCLCSCV